jgi:hypothetical protein
MLEGDGFVALISALSGTIAHRCRPHPHPPLPMDPAGTAMSRHPRPASDTPRSYPSLLGLLPIPVFAQIGRSAHVKAAYVHGSFNFGYDRIGVENVVDEAVARSGRNRSRAAFSTLDGRDTFAGLALKAVIS